MYSGTKRSAESRKKISMGKLGKPSAKRGVPISANFMNKYYYGGKRSDLNDVFFRSRMEANYARILNYNHVPFIYEYKTFRLSDSMSYTPYFYLNATGEYVELKGYMHEKAKAKIAAFTRAYPNVPFKILYYDSSEWKELYEKYSQLIPTWEFTKGGR